MQYATRLTLGLLFAAALTCGAGAQAPVGPPTVYEGATLIVGDGSAPIANAVFVVEGTRFTAVGREGEVEVPAGANRVGLNGMTVMPALVDTHTHLNTERAALIEDLRRRAYIGVGAAMSLGSDGSDVQFEVREETITGAARYRTAGRGSTTPDPVRSEEPHWVTSEE
jgi:imidazolonepropionase-like amidohydrolase